MNSNDRRDAKGGLRRLRRRQILTYAATLAVVAAIPVAAGAASGPSHVKPTGLQNFSLRLGDARATAGTGIPSFSRTPSFAWAPVRGATRYEFELSTGKNFGSDNSIIWSSRTLTTPAVVVPISLPWITGNRTSLYWHVRAYSAGGVSHWSAPRSFNMRWPDVSNKDNADDEVGVPQWLPSEPGYIRWTPIVGATGYDVWFTNVNERTGGGFSKIVSTITTVADEREYYTLRAPSQSVEWRVRARRELYGETQNSLPAVSYGPWSSPSSYQSPAGAVAPTDRRRTPAQDRVGPGRVRQQLGSGARAHAGVRLLE